MAVDTPARIAVIGAGPVGLETALYARYLGYDVDLYERGAVAEHIRQWGHVRLFSPFKMNRSNLGIAALRAQWPDRVFPGDDAMLSGHEWREEYLLPLSQSDLVIDSVQCGMQVISIGRDGLQKGELVGDKARRDYDFRLLVQDQDGNQSNETADIVIDTSGVFGCPNWLGNGGIPAVGETKLRDQIQYGLPDILGSERERYAGRHTLLVGRGFSAATTAVALATLLKEEPQTRLTWLTGGGPENPDELIRPIDQDPLPFRAKLTEDVNRLLASATEQLTVLPNCFVDQVQKDGDRIQVHVGGRPSVTVDEIVANVGYRGDSQISSELQVHLCYASGGPMRLAARLLADSQADCLKQAESQTSELLTPEPDFYILGAKSFGRNSSFLVTRGLDQIRRLFQVIGDREGLDLYSNMSNLHSS